MNIRRTSVAALAAIPLALSACGAPQAGAPQPKPPSPQEIQWAGKLCGQVTEFSAKQKQLPEVNKTNTQTVKDSIVNRLNAASKGADDTVNALKALGPAPMPGGDEVNQSFQQGFSEVRDVLNQSRSVADQIDVSDKEKFTQGISALQTELQRSNQIDLGSKFGKLEQNPELKRSAQLAPECKPFFQAKQPAPQQPPANKPG